LNKVWKCFEQSLKMFWTKFENVLNKFENRTRTEKQNNSTKSYQKMWEN
jgi:hypothetical protein